MEPTEPRTCYLPILLRSLVKMWFNFWRVWKQAVPNNTLLMRKLKLKNRLRLKSRNKLRLRKKLQLPRNFDC